jgi:hypothetical protein
MTEPIKASEVDVESIDEDELETQKRRRLVAERQARRNALKANGALQESSGDGAADLEARVNRIKRDAARKFRASRAVRSRLGE